MSRRNPVDDTPRPKRAVLRLLGGQLRRLRLERKLSQERLAELAGLNYKYIGKIELAKADPGADVIVRLSRALGVTVGDLFDPITPTDRAGQYAFSPGDLDTLASALTTISSTLERIRARQPRPTPVRAPRRSRR